MAERLYAPDAMIQASYTTICFCDRPVLAAGEPFSTEPRFEFRKQAERYAAANGVTLNWFSKRDKVAIGSIDHACSHYPAQSVRLSWRLAY